MVAHQLEGTQGETVVYPGITSEREEVPIVVVRVVPVSPVVTRMRTDLCKIIEMSP